MEWDELRATLDVDEDRVAQLKQQMLAEIRVESASSSPND